MALCTDGIEICKRLMLKLAPNNKTNSKMTEKKPADRICGAQPSQTPRSTVCKSQSPPPSLNRTPEPPQHSRDKTRGDLRLRLWPLPPPPAWLQVNRNGQVTMCFHFGCGGTGISKVSVKRSITIYKICKNSSRNKVSSLVDKAFHCRARGRGFESQSLSPPCIFDMRN